MEEYDSCNTKAKADYWRSGECELELELEFEW